MLQSQNPYSPERIDALTQTLSTMDARTRQKYASDHKNDPAVVAVALNVSNILAAAERNKAMQAGQQQPKVVDQEIAGMAPPPQHMARLPEQQGIAQLQAPNLEGMADGGIAGYADGGGNMAAGGGPASQLVFNNEPVMRMADGGMPRYAGGGLTEKQKFAMQYKDLADQVGKDLGVDPGIIISQWGLETGWGKKQVGQYNLGNIKDVTGKGPTAYDKMEKSKASYKSYETPEAFAADYAGLIKRNFPKAVGAGSDVGAFTAGLQSGEKGAYATDPNYRKSLASTFNALSNVIPSAQAAEVPAGKPAAAAAPEPTPALTDKEAEALSRPAFVTPSSGMGRKEGKLSEVIKSGEAPRQMGLGVSDLPYNILGAPMDIGYSISKAFGNKGPAPALGSEHLKQLGTKYLGREADTTDPTLSKFRTAGELGSMVIDPFATTRKVAQTAEGLEALALAQRAKANAAAEKTVVPTNMRLEPPRTEPPVMAVDSQGRAIPADTLARGRQAVADEAAVGTEAAKAAELEKQAAAYPGSAQRAEMLQKAEMADKVRGATLAAKVGDEATMQKLGITTAPTTIKAGENQYDPYQDMAEGYTKEDKKATIDAVKETVPAKDRKGFNDDDLLTLGLSLMASKSPNLMTAVGESGLQTLAAKREREKGETEKMYRDALIEQAKRPASEVQLIEKYRDDPKFAEAYDKFVQSKREPMTREALLKSWSGSPYLQMTYQNPEDYIKMMASAAGGGASGTQLSAADQSLVQKYLR